MAVALTVPALIDVSRNGTLDQSAHRTAHKDPKPLGATSSASAAQRPFHWQAEGFGLALCRRSRGILRSRVLMIRAAMVVPHFAQRRRPAATGCTLQDRSASMLDWPGQPVAVLDRPPSRHAGRPGECCCRAGEGPGRSTTAEVVSPPSAPPPFSKQRLHHLKARECAHLHRTRSMHRLLPER